MAPPPAARSNAEVAEAIVAIYRGQPAAYEMSELLAPDVVADDWMTPGVVLRGAEAFCRDWYDEVGLAFPDASEEVIATVFDGQELVVHALFRTTFAADHYGIAAHGGRVAWETIDRWVIDGGQIVRVHLMADTHTARHQLAHPHDGPSQ